VKRGNEYDGFKVVYAPPRSDALFSITSSPMTRLYKIGEPVLFPVYCGMVFDTLAHAKMLAFGFGNCAIHECTFVYAGKPKAVLNFECLYDADLVEEFWTTRAWTFRPIMVKANIPPLGTLLASAITLGKEVQQWQDWYRSTSDTSP